MTEENKAVEPVQEPDEQQVQNEQTEKEARVFGWVPKEEFRGSEDDWVDADTFVKRGKEINPILRKNNETLLKKLEEQAKQIEKIKADAEQFKEFQKESFERKKVELEAQIADLKSQKKAAIAEGNGDLVVDLDDRIDELKEAQREAKSESKAPPPADPTSVAMDPEIQSWLDRNTWFGQDTEMTEMSNALGATVRKQFPQLSGREFLDKIDEKLAEYFPEKFMGKRPKVNPVDSSGSVRSSGGSGKKSYDNLPQDAKEACDRFIKNGWIKSKQEYVDAYDWS